MSGTLVQAAATGLGIRGADGHVMAVEWPFGYEARLVDGRIELLDETGAVVARDGDRITSGGGFVNGLWFACGPVAVAPAEG